MRSGFRRVVSIGSAAVEDVTSRFREYARLDRKRTGTGLTIAELERWRLLKRSLTREFSPKVPEDAIDERSSVRVPTRLQVSFENASDLADCLMTNISRHGLFVQTNRPFALQTRFQLTIHVEDPRMEITAIVQVVSVGLGPTFRASQQGMGCRFVDLSPDVEKQIMELYELSVK